MSRRESAKAMGGITPPMAVTRNADGSLTITAGAFRETIARRQLPRFLMELRRRASREAA